MWEQLNNFCILYFKEYLLILLIILIVGLLLQSSLFKNDSSRSWYHIYKQWELNNALNDYYDNDLPSGVVSQSASPSSSASSSSESSLSSTLYSGPK